MGWALDGLIGKREGSTTPRLPRRANLARDALSQPISVRHSGWRSYQFASLISPSLFLSFSPRSAHLDQRTRPASQPASERFRFSSRSRPTHIAHCTLHIAPPDNRQRTTDMGDGTWWGEIRAGRKTHGSGATRDKRTGAPDHRREHPLPFRHVTYCTRSTLYF